MFEALVKAMVVLIGSCWFTNIMTDDAGYVSRRPYAVEERALKHAALRYVGSLMEAMIGTGIAMVSLPIVMSWTPSLPEDEVENTLEDEVFGVDLNAEVVFGEDIGKGLKIRVWSWVFFNSLGLGAM